MSQFLLLRDNKQSGPFTANQLQELGLKPYDLVWQEGKSAAWRYPGEINELKSFAPVVEEQPFDRFYKKPSKEQQPDSAPVSRENSDSVAKKPSPSKVVVERPAPRGVSKQSSKVFVTLPSEGTKQPQPVKERIAPSPIQNEPVYENSSTAASEKNNYDAPQPRYTRYDSSTAYAQTVVGQETNNSRPSAVTHRVDRSFAKSGAFKGLVAASLLLCGVLIGMFYMSRSQQKNIQQLNALVEQIQKKNNQQGLEDMPVRNVSTDVPTETTPADPQQASILDVPETKATEAKKNDVKPIVNAKKADTNKTTILPVPVKTDVADETTINETAGVEQTKNNNEVPKEVARKNLFQLVNVKGNDYKTGLFGGISNLKLTLTNKSTFQLEKVEVKLEYMGPENKIVRTQSVFFEDVSPGEQLTLEVPKSGRGVSVSYAIKQINSRELGIAQASL